jgi:hypothetical protein
MNAGFAGQRCAMEIEGEHYWDGGLVSNTPLQWVVDGQFRVDTLAFQVDLWSARGELPRTIAEVSTRQKDIRRTRAGTNSFKHVQRLRRAAADLFEKLPQHLQDSPEAQLLRPTTYLKSAGFSHDAKRNPCMLVVSWRLAMNFAREPFFLRTENNSTNLTGSPRDGLPTISAVPRGRRGSAELVTHEHVPSSLKHHTPDLSRQEL